MLESRYRIHDCECLIPDSGYRIPDRILIVIVLLIVIDPLYFHLFRQDYV